MVKTNTTISLGSEIKDKIKKILKQKRSNLSLWIEEMGRKLIEDYEKEVKK